MFAVSCGDIYERESSCYSTAHGGGHDGALQEKALKVDKKKAKRKNMDSEGPPHQASDRIM